MLTDGKADAATDGKGQKRAQPESSSADFADCLSERTLGAVGCGKTVTFDIGAAARGL
jgi:predicted nucleic-acid-binding protein